MAVVESRGRVGEQVPRPSATGPVTSRGALAPLIESLLGPDLPIGFEAYDGTRLGPPDPPATIVVRSPDALRRMATAPGELGLARAYVAGDIDFEGDIFAALEVSDKLAKSEGTAFPLRALAGSDFGFIRTFLADLARARRLTCPECLP